MLGEIPAILAKRSGVRPEQIAEVFDKLEPAIHYYRDALRVRADVADSRAVMGFAQRHLCEELFRRVTPWLDAGAPLLPWQMRLLAFWTPVTYLLNKQRARVAEQQAKGKRTGRRRAAELRAAEAYVEMLQTMVELKAGKQVDPDRVRRAAAELEALKARELSALTEE